MDVRVRDADVPIRRSERSGRVVRDGLVPQSRAAERLRALPGVVPVSAAELLSAARTEARALARYCAGLVNGAASVAIDAGDLTDTVIAALPEGCTVVSGRAASAEVAIIMAAVDSTGLLCTDADAAEAKSAMLAAAARRILIVAPGGLGSSAGAFCFGSLDMIDVAVTIGPVEHDGMRLLSGAAEVHVIDPVGMHPSGLPRIGSR
ncbi:MAG: hypothetical protein ABWZ77_03380 [Naasia sp.]